MSQLSHLEAWMAAFQDPGHVFRVSAVLLGIGQIVTSLEYLWMRREFGPGGTVPWPVLRLFRPARSHALTDLRDRIFCQRGVTVLLSLRLLCAAALVLFGANTTIALVAILGLTGLLLAFHVRIPWGLEGADDLSVHIALGLSVFAVCRGVDAPSLGLYYIAAYSGVAYVTAGVTKLARPQWRSGEALGWALNLQAFGAPWAMEFFSLRPRLRCVLAWAVMLAEVGAPLAVLLPAPAMAAALVAGVGFHVTLAVCMGLNTFAWAFPCTYPAALLVWTVMPHLAGK